MSQSQVLLKSARMKCRLARALMNMNSEEMELEELKVALFILLIIMSASASGIKRCMRTLDGDSVDSEHLMYSKTKVSRNSREQPDAYGFTPPKSSTHFINGKTLLV